MQRNSATKLTASTKSSTAYEIHVFACIQQITYSTTMLKFKLEAISISSTVHVRWPDVGGWRCWFKQVSV